MALTVTISLPGIDDSIWYRLAHDGANLALNIEIFTAAFRRNRFTSGHYSLNKQRTRQLEQRLQSGASSVKKGPRTLLSVAPLIGGLFSASTSAEAPRISERRMNSCRRGVQVWPTRVKYSIVFIHSSVVMDVSDMNWCRWVIRLLKMRLTRLQGQHTY